MKATEIGPQERILGIGTLSTKGQVTIPSEARELFKLEVGAKLLFIEKKGELIIRKA